MNKLKDKIHKELRNDSEENVNKILQDLSMQWFLAGLLTGAIVMFLIELIK